MTTHPNDLPEAVKAAIREAVKDIKAKTAIRCESEDAATRHFAMQQINADIDRVFTALRPLWPVTPSADAVGKAASEIVRYDYGFHHGDSAGTSSALAYYDQTGKDLPGYVHQRGMVAAILTRHFGSGQTFGHVAEGGVAPGANGSPGDAGSTPAVSTPPANQEWAKAAGEAIRREWAHRIGYVDAEYFAKIILNHTPSPASTPAPQGKEGETGETLAEHLASEVQNRERLEAENAALKAEVERVKGERLSFMQIGAEKANLALSLTTANEELESKLSAANVRLAEAKKVIELLGRPVSESELDDLRQQLAHEKDLNALAAALDNRVRDLTQQLSQARSDTERLDWLESAKGRCGYSETTYIGEGYFAHAHTQGDKYDAAETLRAAIDTARGKGGAET